MLFAPEQYSTRNLAAQHLLETECFCTELRCIRFTIIKLASLVFYWRYTPLSQITLERYSFFLYPMELDEITASGGRRRFSCLLRTMCLHAVRWHFHREPADETTFRLWSVHSQTIAVRYESAPIAAGSTKNAVFRKAGDNPPPDILFPSESFDHFGLEIRKIIFRDSEVIDRFCRFLWVQWFNMDGIENSAG